MQKQSEKQIGFFHPWVITINLLIIFMVGNAFEVGYYGKAADQSPPTNTATVDITKVEGDQNQIDTLSSQLCLLELAKYADPEFESYQTFMEENFKNKSSTKSLLDLGIQRYDQFKAAIGAEMDVLIGKQLAVAATSGATSAAQYGPLDDCQAKADEYIANAGKLLQMRAYTTSSIKKASIFTEKYKQINEKLRTLDLDVMKMVLNIRTFEEKLPCYLKKCV